MHWIIIAAAGKRKILFLMFYYYQISLISCKLNLFKAARLWFVLSSLFAVVAEEKKMTTKIRMPKDGANQSLKTTITGITLSLPMLRMIIDNQVILDLNQTVISPLFLTNLIYIFSSRIFKTRCFKRKTRGRLWSSFRGPVKLLRLYEPCAAKPSTAGALPRKPWSSRRRGNLRQTRLKI